MPKSVFISYCWQQGDWVFDRLIPCLQAAGVPYHVDKERFKAGRALKATMDEWQDKADINLLIFSPDYLVSENCQHEFRRAIKRDKKFARGMVVPVMRVECTLPAEMKKANPIYVKLTSNSDKEAEPWRKLIEACEGSLRTCPVEWLNARDQTRLFLKQNESVNLVVQGDPSWRQLIDHLRADELHQLGLVNLDDPTTFSRRGLVQAMLNATGSPIVAPQEPDDLAALGRVIESRSSTRIVLTHFDRVATRDYGKNVDLFVALRYWIMDLRKLVLLAQSRAPFNNLVPPDPHGSPIILKTVELVERK